ncbi:MULTISPECIES: 3D domain-containing protein [unclassified Exiguobacterium]|uniref:3D domain-containing protein n=2 Tax=Bacillales Family XII. Incertae Sedis TaxID=539742 RepID=UPI001F61075B|nr:MULTISPECIES: 3D domain-containing protein [unclassified Exiguobacterium]
MITVLMIAAGSFAFAATADAAQIGIGTEQKIVQNPLELERKAIEQERQQQIAREKRLAEQKRIAEEKRVAEAKRIAEEKRVAEEKAEREQAEREALAEEKRAAAEQARQEEAKRQAVAVKKQSSTATASPVSTTGRSIQAESTAYTNDAADNGSYGGRVLTATGHDVTDSIYYNGMRIIAVDPAVIPLGTVVQIEGVGQAIALDTGGRIKGNIVDLLVDTKSEAINWGRRHITITLP